MNPKVDRIIANAKQWGPAFEILRAAALESGLEEHVKWGVPCYTWQDENVALIHGFKEYCAILFFKGALLKDKEGILVQQTANVQAARQIRFTSTEDAKKLSRQVKVYLKEAIDVERKGLKVEFKKTEDFDMPAEFLDKLEESPALQEAFYALTPGRQRGYLLHFASAKQSKTREARVEKCIPRILDGKGLDD